MQLGGAKAGSLVLCRTATECLQARVSLQGRKKKQKT